MQSTILEAPVLNTYSTLATRYKRFAPDPELHGSYFPADIYPGENISATVRKSESTEAIEADARVWRLSPLGLEVILRQVPPAVRGQLVDVELKLGQERLTVRGVTVISDRNEHGASLLGIRLIDANGTPYSGPNRRGGRRWVFGDHFCPIAVATNPARFNDFVYFRVRDVSARGMRLSTSLRNKFLVRGMKLHCMVSLPLVSQFDVDMTIENIELENDPDRPSLLIGTSFGAVPESALKALGQYLVQFGAGVQLDELRREGLIPKSVSTAVEFSFVRTIEEYNEVLALRHWAYMAAGKIDGGLQPADMGEIYDTRSRIVIGRFHGKIVASAGLVFSEYHDRMEIEENLDWPSELPRRDEMVEVIRNCTHPLYRGNDLLMAMFKFIAITVLQAKRRYVVIGCTPDLVPLYSKIGMTDLNLEYRHRKLGGSMHTVMIGDIPTTMGGRNINPLYWNAIWSEAARFMMTSQLLQLTTIDVIRMKAFRMLQPLSMFLQNRMKRPRKMESRIAQPPKVAT